MNLLVASTWWPCPPDNGSRMRAYHLIRHLAKRHRITLFAFGRGGGAPEERGPLEELCAEVHPVPRPRPAGHALGLRGLLSRVPRHFVQGDSPVMRGLLSAASATHDLALALQIEAACHLADCAEVPRVFDEVEITIPRDRATTARSALGRARHRLTWLKHRSFVRDLVNRFDAATVVSEPERLAVAAMGVDLQRVSIVPNGIEVGPLCTEGRPRFERVVYPGSVMYSANLDAVQYFVTEIFPLLRRERPALELWVTGETGDIDLTALRAPGVTFTGYVPDVKTVIAESAACVVPLRVGGGTRVKVLQAMALGTPVVSTPKGIEGLDLEANRHVLIADTPAAFAHQVRRVLADPSGAAALSHRARAFVEDRYGWQVIGEALDRVLDDARARYQARRRGVLGGIRGAV